MTSRRRRLPDTNRERVGGDHESSSKSVEKSGIQPIGVNLSASDRSEITRPRVLRKLKSTPRPPRTFSGGESA